MLKTNIDIRPPKPPGAKMDMFFNPSSSFSLTDRETQLSYRIEWKNNSITPVDVKETYNKLHAPYDPTNTGGRQSNNREDYQIILLV